MPALRICHAGWIGLAGGVPPAAPTGGTQAEMLAKLLFYLLLLVVLFFFGSYAVLRASRRFRERLAFRPAKPTDNRDVWAMHKLPEDNDSIEEPPPPSQEPGEP